MAQPCQSNRLSPRERPQRRGCAARSCTALVLCLLGAGLVVLLLSYVRLRRPLPAVPPLPAAPATIARPPVVRVLIARSKPELSVSCRGRGTWYGVDAGEPRVALLGTGPWVVSSKGERLALDGAEQPEAALELRPYRGAFQLEGRAYRGSLLVKLEADGGLIALNVLEPEQYLRSVVGSEMYSSWPLNALMAQAVAARTFMLHAVEAKGHLNRADMSYKGVAGESRSTDLAVELTRGIILTYEGRLLPAYFQSTCGGATTAAGKVFAEEPMRPLAGVSCDWCRRSPWYEWRAEVPAALLADLFADKGLRTVRSIVPEGTEPDGYARFVTINGKVRMAAGAFRRAVGPGLIKSARFRVTAQGDRFIFEGRGYGHGVGLCQWGARGLAQTGTGWQDILRHYYPGAVLRKAY